MAFDKKPNRHEAWKTHTARNAAMIAEFGLPMTLFNSQRTLSEFLTAGCRNDIGADIESLSEEQFDGLFKFVTSWFDYNAVNFTALERRRLRSRPRDDLR